MSESLSKVVSYAVLTQIDERMTKTVGYAVLLPQADVRLTKLVAYAVLMPATPSMQIFLGSGPI